MRFVWIGGDISRTTIRPTRAISRIKSSAWLGTTTSIIDAIADVEPAYALAGRLLPQFAVDPLPNVTIDAALRAIPVVCFEGATGMADLLAADALASQCVVPYLDVGAAAGAIARLADNERERIEIGEATRRIAEATFDTDRVRTSAGRARNRRRWIMRQRKEDFATLRNDPLFDASVYLPPRSARFRRGTRPSMGSWRGGSPWACFAIPRRTVCSGAHASAFTHTIYAHENRGSLAMPRGVNPARALRPQRQAGWSVVA
mgnify:CR=1 FL=1